MNNSITDPSIHVYACISSPNDYNNNSPVVFEALQKKSKTYTDNMLKTLTTILSDPNTSPISRFYALYLLAKASELKNDFLMTRMIKSRALLDRIFKDCQFDGLKPIEEKGKKFFSPAPTAGEAILGNNYVRLLLECFAFWNQTYGTDVTNNPLYAYRIMYSTLLEKIKFPEVLLFFNGASSVSDDFHHLPVLGRSPTKSATERLGESSQRKSPSKVNESINSNKLSPQKAQNTQRSVDMSEEKNPVITRTKEALEQLAHNKNAFRECLENNKDENDMAELVDYLHNDVANAYNSQVYPNVESLIAGGGPSSERYVTQIFAEGDTVNQLSTEFNNYKKGKTSYRDFRARVVPLLRVQGNTAATQESKQFITPGGPDEIIIKQESGFKQPQQSVQEFNSKSLEADHDGTDIIHEANYEVQNELIGSAQKVPQRIDPIQENYEAEVSEENKLYVRHEQEDEARFTQTNDQQIQEPFVPGVNKNKKKSLSQTFQNLPN